MQIVELQELINRQQPFGTLATSSRTGEPNLAVFGSGRVRDDGHLVMGLGANRSLANLEENPRAAFLCALPDPHPLRWRGIRLYLEVAAIHRDGSELERLREEISRAAGPAAARMVCAAVSFRILHTRPLIDLAGM